MSVRGIFRGFFLGCFGIPHNHSNTSLFFDTLAIYRERVNSYAQGLYFFPAQQKIGIFAELVDLSFLERQKNYIKGPKNSRTKG